MEVRSNKVIFNPFFDKKPLGAVLKNDEITLTVRFPSHYKIWDLTLIIEDDEGEIYLKEQFNISISFQIDKIGIYWYCFKFTDVYGCHYLVSSENLDAVISENHEYLWQINIHDPFFKETKWFEGKVMYQIMVDRFYKGGNNPPREDVIIKEWGTVPNYEPVDGVVYNNDFYGGDLQGIIKKLDYLQSLNISIIYLNPIFKAYSNHKYDTGDYLQIDPMFGSEEDFIQLCQEANKRDMKIMLDGVFNHTGDDSIYFNKYNNYDSIGAYNSKSSKYYPWYQFIDYPEDYMSWWGIKTLPTVNQDNKDYQEFTDRVLRKWFRLGISGFRLDVVDELSNEFVMRINKVAKEENKANVLIGEVWKDASNKVAYGKRKHYFNGHQLDSVMNYVFKNGIIAYLRYHNLNVLQNCIRNVLNNYPPFVVNKLMNVMDTHDTARLINNFAYVINPPKDKAAKYKMTEHEYKNAIVKMKMATIMQFTLPGVPCIYYGDEAGMIGFDDPFCRGTFPWDNINMDLFNWYQRLGEVRNLDVFQDGKYQEIYAYNNVFIYARIKLSRIIVIINNSDQAFEYAVTGKDLINNKYLESVIVPSQTGLILETN